MTDAASHDSPSERDVDDGIASHDITCVDCDRAMRVVTDASGRLRSTPCDCVANLRARVAELERLAAGPSTREPMGFAEAIDAVRRGRVGPATCAACNGEWGMSRDNCAACGYPSVHVDIETWGRVLG